MDISYLHIIESACRQSDDIVEQRYNKIDFRIRNIGNTMNCIKVADINFGRVSYT